MAEIEIERKQGSAWIWWLLAAIVAAFLLWWLFSALDSDDDLAMDDESVAVIEEPITEPTIDPATEAMGTVITDLATLTGANVSPGLAGREVALQGVPVSRAVSDLAFWIGSEETPEAGVFAIRGNQTASFTAPDGDVDDGATVNVWGEVADMPQDLTQTATEWNLESTDQSLLNSEGVYILADSIRLAGM